MGSWVIACLLLLHWFSAAISHEMEESTNDTAENVHYKYNDENGTQFQKPFRPSKKLLTVLTTKVKRDFQISSPAEETFIYHNNGGELSTASYFDYDENDEGVKGSGVILYEIDEDIPSKTKDEVHYHDHKHYHEHEHKQEHVHQHKQENSHIHSHSHKQNSKHQHNKLEYHEHEHKGTHFHAHEGIHRHSHRGNHKHKHNQAKGHHKRRHSKDKPGNYCGSTHRRIFKKKPKRVEKL